MVFSVGVDNPAHRRVGMVNNLMLKRYNAEVSGRGTQVCAHGSSSLLASSGEGRHRVPEVTSMKDCNLQCNHLMLLFLVNDLQSSRA